MAAFNLSIDEDLLVIRTRPGLLNILLFFKSWNYRLELPVNRIRSVELERRGGVLTLILIKNSKDQGDKRIAVSLLQASKKQVDFIENALPAIIEKRLSMHEINEFKQQYLY